LPAASTRYLDPVTHPAAPRKVSFAMMPAFYWNPGVSRDEKPEILPTGGV